MNVRSWARDDLGEALVLGQEAVARVDRVAAGDQRRRDDRRRREVRALRVGRADADRLVGELDRQRVAVRLAVGDDRLDAERPAGAQDAQRDLAAVGDEDLAEHRLRRPRPAADGASSMTISSWPYSTASPGSTRLAPTMPSTGATTSWATPSMSTTPSRSPARTRVPAGLRSCGWKMPTAGDVATDAAAVRSALAVTPVAARRDRGPTGVSAGRPPGAAPCAGSRPARSAGRARGPGAIRGAAQPDLPVALADLELAEAGRGRAWRSGRAAARRRGGRWRRGRRRARRRHGVGAAWRWRIRALARPPRAPAARRATTAGRWRRSARRPGSSRSRRRSPRPRPTGGRAPARSASV